MGDQESAASYTLAVDSEGATCYADGSTTDLVSSENTCTLSTYEGTGLYLAAEYVTLGSVYWMSAEGVASYSAAGELDDAVVVYVNSSGDIAAVYVGSTKCTAQTDGTYTYTSGSDIYTLTIWCDSGSYSYSYEVTGSSSYMVYATLVTMLSFLLDGCTIALPPKLTSAQLANFVTALKNTSLSNVTLDMSYMTITQVNEKTFYGCENITSVIIGDSVTLIGDRAFYKCTSLTSVTIPDSVTSIGSSAFYKCTSLTSVTIPDSVTSIGDSAFYYCTSLTTVTIPDSVTSIGVYTFEYCTSLTEVTIGNSVTSIGDYAFACCYPLKELTIGDSVTSIGGYAFLGCSSLTSIEIPDSVTSLGTYVFNGCTSLVTAVIGEGVEEIPWTTFYDCTSLTTVTIGSAVTTISAYSSSANSDGGAFGNCSALETVYYNGTTSEWGEISISAINYTTGNYYLKKASIICTDGTYTY